MEFKENLDFLVGLLGSLPDGVIGTDNEGNVVVINELALRYLGLPGSAQTYTGRNLLSLSVGFPELYEKLGEFLLGKKEDFNLRAIPFRERYLTLKGRGFPMGKVLTLSDVTPTKMMEMASLNAMLQGQENERQRLAKEIHDGLGPLLSTLRLNIEGIRGQTGDDTHVVDQRYDNIYELLTSLTQEVRTISHDLMPAALIDFGLIAALENLCRKVRESGKLDIQFYTSGMEGRLDQQTELGLYRIAQELLNNVFKYAHADHVNVQLIRHSASVLLMIEDDGIGFDMKKVMEQADRGIGLRNIATRTKTLGGTFILDTQPGKGTVATVEVPIST